MMDERKIQFEIVIEGECTLEEQSAVSKLYDFINEYTKDKGYIVNMKAGIKELMENENKNVVSVKVDLDTAEAIDNTRELTTAANECIDAFERLEKAIVNLGKSINAPKLFWNGTSVDRYKTND